MDSNIKVANRVSYQESTSEGLVDTAAVYLLEEVQIFHSQVVAECDPNKYHLALT
jgi:hypothetical protein